MIPTNIEKDAIKWLARLNSPELSKEEETTFFNWLGSSPLHQAAFIKAEDLWERGDVLQRLSSENAQAKPFAWNWAYAAVACSCFVAACIFFLKPQMGAAPEYEVSTHIGQQVDHVLDDGSTLLLNTNSTISVSMDKKRRIVRLQKGEVFFDVAPDKNRPFEVHTQAGIVRVLGTRFTVKTDSADDQKMPDALVTVLEGKVGLLEAKNSAPLTTLTADEQLSLQSASAGAKPSPVNAKALTAWKQKKLVFDGEDLASVVKEVNRYFETKIRLSGDDLAQKDVIAVIQLKDQNSTHMALAQALGLRLEPSSNHNTVELKRNN